MGSSLTKLTLDPRTRIAALTRSRMTYVSEDHEHPLVLPQVSHFRQVPLRTIVKFWHSEQATPT